MQNQEILSKLSECVEFGKVNKAAPYPPAMKDQDGADELTRQALDMGIEPNVILNEALIAAMDKVGEKFTQKKIFVPQMLISAKAMNAAMEHLKPYFQSGQVKRKGKMIIGTVSGDLHDIGKNLVAMIVEGAGWEIVDLGVDVNTAKFLDAIAAHPGAVVGLSALLTTTMGNMQKTVAEIHEKHPDVKLLIGGAPVNEDFCNEIGANAYAAGPQEAVSYLNSLVA
ncbi:cobalamin B12-binding domain-containing protein [Roseimarinus sediminis]|jgi:5-methyltetrahydrofolate--homocysteine methyltransferase|uniref:cobalamin B12-binding domain-containing protein n=1 Tax=Roseimarinus sediminis TaxID=1610899 RepID=UPI003D1F6EF6